MAIHPPSDIVLDVARAGDPVRVQAAVDKLARMAGPGAPQGDTFSEVLGATGSVVSPGAVPAGANDVLNMRNRMQIEQLSVGALQRSKNPYEGFEAVMLQSFVEYMLPKSTAGFFGDDSSEGVMRGMLSEQIAAQMAKTGKLGIAKLIAKQRASIDAAAAATGHSAQPMPIALRTSPHTAAASYLLPTRETNESGARPQNAPIDIRAGLGST